MTVPSSAGPADSGPFYGPARYYKFCSARLACAGRARTTAVDHRNSDMPAAQKDLEGVSDEACDPGRHSRTRDDPAGPSARRAPPTRRPAAAPPPPDPATHDPPRP